jgi:hypothetical protein
MLRSIVDAPVRMPWRGLAALLSRPQRSDPPGSDMRGLFGYRSILALRGEARVLPELNASK